MIHYQNCPPLFFKDFVPVLSVLYLLFCLNNTKIIRPKPTKLYLPFFTKFLPPPPLYEGQKNQKLHFGEKNKGTILVMNHCFLLGH